PSSGLSLSAMRRATKSVGPPAGKATTMRMTREGKSCAWMSAAANANNAMNTAAKAVFNRSNRISTSENYDLNALLLLDVPLIAWRSALPPVGRTAMASRIIDRPFSAYSSRATDDLRKGRRQSGAKRVGPHNIEGDES